MTENTFNAPALLLPWEAENRASEQEEVETMARNGPVFYTQNWGHHHDTWKRFVEIIEQHKPDHIGWQETGDQAVPLSHIVRETGYRLFNGTGLVGQASTPIMYNPDTVKFIRSYIRFLHGPARIQTNAHKFQMMKAKWLIGGVFERRATGRRHIHGNVHIIYNQDMQPNGNIAKQMMENLAERTENVALPIGITGDWNMNVAESPRATPVRKDGYRSARKVVNVSTTDPSGGHGGTKHGVIDDLVAKGQWRFKRGLAVRSTSDHDGVIFWTELGA